GATPENVSFGYNGASPDTAVPGNVAGGQSTIADATVIIRKVGDIGGNDPNYNFSPNFPDGVVNAEDINYAFNHYLTGTRTAAEIAVADVGGNDANYNFSPDSRDCL